MAKFLNILVKVPNFFLNKKNSKEFFNLFYIFLFIFFISVGVYLVGQQTSFQPKASEIKDTIKDPQDKQLLKKEIKVFGVIGKEGSIMVRPLKFIAYCDPEQNGGLSHASVTILGTFEFILKKGQKYCLRPLPLEGFTTPASIEYQVAGFDCNKKEKNKKICKGEPNIKLFDSPTDEKFKFFYKKI